jgi:outer membrane protein
MRKAVAAASVVLAAVLGGSMLPGAPAGAQAPAAAPAQKIGFIDIQRVLVRSAAGVAAREQLEKEKAAMQREMDAKRQELDKLRDELEKKGSLMSADARRDKEDSLERKRRDAARLADDFQRELVRKEQQLLVRVQQDLAGVIERIGKQRGYYLIVERRGAGVLYHSPEADLTDEIIRAYDQEAATKGKK